MALLLVLVAVMALTFIIAGLYESSQASWDELTFKEPTTRRVCWPSGLSIALHPDVKPGDVALTQAFGTERSFQVLATNEGGCR